MHLNSNGKPENSTKVPAWAREMKKIMAIVQIVFVVLLIGFSTVELFLGNLPAAMSTFPLIILLYFFVAATQKRSGQ